MACRCILSNADLLTKVEAQHWLATGTLPDDFRQRVENHIKFYNCPNCDGVQDMNAVMRTWEDEPSWCDSCVPEDDPIRVELGSQR